MRRVFFVVVNGLCRLDELRADAKWLACIQISVESWEIAAGDFDPDFMAGQKGVARNPQVYLVAINLAGLNKGRLAL
jgi:hypothetical protein